MHCLFCSVFPLASGNVIFVVGGFIFRWISAQPEFPPSPKESCSSDRNPFYMCMYVDNANNEICLHCCTLRLMSLPTYCLKCSNQSLFISALMNSIDPFSHSKKVTIYMCSWASCCVKEHGTDCNFVAERCCDRIALWQLMYGNFCKKSTRFYINFTLASWLGKTHNCGRPAAAK